MRNANGESEPASDAIYLEPAFIAAAAGDFSMGRPYAGSESNEVPVHTVTLAAYQLGKFPVTNQQYADVLNWALAQGYLQDIIGHPYASGKIYAYGKFIADTQSSSSDAQIAYTAGRFQVRSRQGYDNLLFSMAEHPAVRVSWHGAVVFCNWLSAMLGLDPCYNVATWERIAPLRNGYRLPTEAEWERAAAWDGAQHWMYGFSSDVIDITRANHECSVENRANPLGLTTTPSTSPVGWYNGVNPARLSAPATLTADSPSPVNAYDMAGNVWEWCHDWAYRTYTTDPVDNPTGPTEGVNRVLRGGAYNTTAYACRAARRNHYAPENGYHNIGFRLSRTP